MNFVGQVFNSGLLKTPVVWHATLGQAVALSNAH